MPTNNEFNRRSYLKLAGVSVGAAVTGLQSDVASAATTTEPTGYGIDGYGLSGYGSVSIDGSISVSTESPTEIRQTSAKLEGTLTDLGGSSSAEVVFEWGPASADLEQTTSAQLVSDTETVTATIEELTPGTTYGFRVVAVGSNGSRDTGSERQFTTKTSATELGSETTLQPRDADIVNALYESEHEGYQGDGFVNFRQSDSYVTWDVENETTDEFELTIRYALGADERTGLLTAGETRREVTLQPTGGWSSWETTTERVTLPAGTSQLRVEATGEDFGNVDLVTATRVSADSPSDETPDSSASKTLLPRDGELVNALSESEHEGYTGNGYVNFEQSDSYVQWAVESSTATAYEMTVRYALGAGERTGLLTAGDSQRELTVQSTGGWSAWEMITERITLPEGSSTLRIEAIGEDFGNADAVVLTPIDEPADEAWDSKTLLVRDGERVNAPSESEHEGYTGDGFINFQESDSYVEWDIKNSEAADFEVAIRYALGAADRTGLLTAGDSQRELTVQSTGGWSSWETTTERVSLPAGSSKLRIEATGEDFGNVDRVELNRLS